MVCPPFIFLALTCVRMYACALPAENQDLAHIGDACMQKLLRAAGTSFTHDQWTLVCDSLLRLFNASTPHKLIDSREQLFFNLGLAPEPPAVPHHEHRRSVTDPSLAGAHFASLHQEVGDHIASAVRRHTDSGGDASGAGVGSSGSATPRGWVIGQQVETAYGGGRVEDIRGDGVAVVWLAYGIAFMPTAMAAKPPTVPAPTPRAGHAARRSPKARGDGSAIPFAPNQVVTKCVIQLGLIQCVGIVVHDFLSCLDESHVRALAAVLKASATFARRFNADRQLREALLSAGFTPAVNKLPSLLKQETSSKQQLLSLLFNLYAGRGSNAFDGQALAKDLLETYVANPVVRCYAFA